MSLRGIGEVVGFGVVQRSAGFKNSRFQTGSVAH